MGFRFFKRIQLAPGISINLSRSGVSASLGPRGAKVTLGPRGIRKTVGLPGTGMYYTTHSSWKSKKKTPPPPPEEASAAEEESAAEEPQLALGFFDRLVTPENEENFIDGLRAFLEGELEKALDFFSRSPECPDGAFVGGIIALRLERFAEAADLLCRALDDADKFGSLFDRYEIELDIALPVTDEVELHITWPSRRAAMLALVEAYQALGDYDGTLDLLQELYEEDPGDSMVRVSLAEILLELSAGAPNEAELLRQIAGLADGVEPESSAGQALLDYRKLAGERLRKLGR